MDSGFKIKNENPVVTAGFFSKCFFTWMIGLYRTAIRQRFLGVSDLYKILPSNDSESLGNRLEENWRRELVKAKLHNRPPKLLMAITKTFFWHYMVYGSILFVQHVALRTCQPIVMAYLISLFSNFQETNWTEMYICAAILITISFLIVFSMHHVNYGQLSIGMQIRVAVSSLIYRKTLKLSKRALHQTDIGQVVNLLSNDVSRFDLVIITLHYVWIMPFQVFLISYLLWFKVGYAGFVGVATIGLLSLPVQGYLGKLSSNFRVKVAQRTDYRVTLMSEIITGIQVIKMYAWEKPFEKIVRNVRQYEVSALKGTSYLRGIYLSFMIFMERLALFATLTAQVLLKQPILAEIVFSMTQFFNLLQLTMSIFYPMSVTYGAEALVAINRIQRYLMLEEIAEVTFEYHIEKGVCLENVEASWTGEKVLKNITVDIPQGSLCVVIGSVGSGKSSLLNLILGELHPQTGSIKLQGSISYASQDSWLFASSVRNNILFGQKYDKYLYNRVVKACALQRDFEQLSNGDKTFVGERGTSLSGGQRARVNLARAVYRDAEIYLLDDPLSAVDPHVGKHLFEECILKYLGNKTRILITHQLQYLKKADLILLMNEGKIQAQGTFEELLAMNLKFTDEMIAEEEDVVVHQKTPLLLSSSFAMESVELKSTQQIQEEEEESREDSGAPLNEYLNEFGNNCQIIFMILLLAAAQLLASGSDYWLTFWTQQEAFAANITQNQTTVPMQQIIEFYGPDNLDTFHLLRNVTQVVTVRLVETNSALYIYTAMILTLIVVTVTRSLYYYKLAMNASQNLHNRMFESLLEAPMRFFNKNPSGRILNRFSKDMGAVDEILPKVLLESIQITLVMCGILVMVVVSNYYMIAVVVILGFLFMKMRSWFILTAKNIKHLEGITKSPMFSHLNSTLQGMTTIRACNTGKLLRKEFDVLQNAHTSAWFLTIMCTVSFGLWLDLICVAFIACTTFGFIILAHYGQVSGSLVGLAISQSLILTGMLQYGIRQTAEVVNQLTSVERILQYTEIEKEGPFISDAENLPQKPWPSEGRIDIQELCLQYDLYNPPVLKNLSVRIKPGQKIGIVGRTGAGKSSLITALFRLTDIDGNIFIDDVDTKTIGLNDLRTAISIIPQEPVLFSANLRYNLDPFNEFSDQFLWKVLEEVELKDAITSLEMTVAGGGGNFSVGQRQLLCLARAILRNNKILVLDEATANIDPKTDSLIQKTIRRKFKHCTVLTVAHRLNTIMDSDRVIVMDDGQVVEFDYPYKLLQKPETTFYKMVLETGTAMSIHLEDIALDAFLNRKLEEESY